MELTEEHIDRNILRLAGWAAIENILHLMVFIVDLIMIARLGTQAIAAVGIAGVLSFVLTMLFSALSIGTSSIVARHVGAKEPKEAGAFAAQGIALTLATSGVLSVLMAMLAFRMIRWMGSSPEDAALGTVYLRTVACFVVFRLSLFVGSGLMRSAGDTLTPMLITLLTNCINIVLNWLLIFGIWIFPRLEVRGAALATGAAYVAGCAAVFWVLLFRRGALQIRAAQLVVFDRGRITRILRVAAPTAIENTLWQIGYLAFVRIVNGLGTAEFAAHQIALRVESLSFMPGHALAVSAATLMGQSLGAGKPELAAQSIRRNCEWALLAMGVVAACLITFPSVLVSIFSPEPGVVRLSSACVAISAFEQPGLAICMVYSGALRGAGDTFSPMIVTMLATFLLRIPLVYTLGLGLNFGLVGIWAGTVVEWACRALIIYLMFQRGRWRRLRI